MGWQALPPAPLPPWQLRAGIWRPFLFTQQPGCSCCWAPASGTLGSPQGRLGGSKQGSQMLAEPGVTSAEGARPSVQTGHPSLPALRAAPRSESGFGGASVAQCCQLSGFFPSLTRCPQATARHLPGPTAKLGEGGSGQGPPGASAAEVCGLKRRPLCPAWLSQRPCGGHRECRTRCFSLGTAPRHGAGFLFARNAPGQPPGQPGGCRSLCLRGCVPRLSFARSPPPSHLQTRWKCRGRGFPSPSWRRLWRPSHPPAPW